MVSSIQIGGVCKPRKDPRAGTPSSSDFNWSPDVVLKRQSRVNNRQLSRNINIITGAPLPMGRTGATFTNSTAARQDDCLTDPGRDVSETSSAFTNDDSRSRSLFATVTSGSKAPYLNMRRQAGSDSGGYHRQMELAGSAVNVSPSGFHPAMAVSGSHAGAGNSRKWAGEFGYSRHGGMKGGIFSAG